MTAEQREQVKECLHSILGENPADWDHLVEIRCPKDATVRKEVQRLLQLNTRMGQFLETPAVKEELFVEAGKLIGTTLGKGYLIQELLGEGSFGLAFRAANVTLNSMPVVVKVLRDGVFAKGSLKQEIQALSVIDDPGVVGILDAGETDQGQSYIVLRYVEGPTLREVLSKRIKFDTGAVDRFARQLSKALRACHEAGILHLDLKPENVILKHFGTKAEQATIVDFGAAEVLGRLEARTDSPSHQPRLDRYCAPELSRDEKPVPASDVYSLGVMIAELLTGEQFEGKATLKRLPWRWRSLIRRATADNRDIRFQSIALLENSIPMRVGPLAVAAAIGVASLILSTAWILTSADRRPHFPAPIPLTTMPGEESNPEFSPDGESVFFSHAATDPGPRNIYVKRVSGGDAVRLTHGQVEETDPVCSRDGKTLAFLRAQGHGVRSLHLMPVQGGADREVSRGRFHSMTWAPDGSGIVASFPEQAGESMVIRLFDLGTGKWRDLIKPGPEGRGDGYPAFSADGRRVTFIRYLRNRGPGEVFVQDVSLDLKVIGAPRQLSFGGAYCERPTFSADGRFIFFSAGTTARNSLWYVPSDGSRREERVLEAEGSVDSPTVSHSRSRIAFSRTIDDVNIWGLDLSAPGGVVKSQYQVVSSTWDDEEVKISPDSQTIAFVSHRTGSEQVWLSSLRGSDVRQLTQFKEGSNLQAYWSPDGRSLLVTGYFHGGIARTYVVSATDGRASDVAGGLAEIGSGWSRDGSMVYFVAPNLGPSRLWRVPVSGGRRELVSTEHADFAQEPVWGNSVFYCKRQDGSLWELKQGVEKKLFDGIARRAFAVCRDGVYYVSKLTEPKIRFYRFSDKQHVDVFRFQKTPGFGLDVSPDGLTVLFVQYDLKGDDLMIVDGFRAHTGKDINSF